MKSLLQVTWDKTTVRNTGKSLAKNKKIIWNKSINLLTFLTAVKRSDISKSIFLRPVFSKLFEKLLLKLMEPVIEANELIPSHQFRFR